MTRFRRAAITVLLCGAVLGMPLAPAHATAYRYWTYWHASPGSSAWTFAGTGPTYRPSDGAVEGWRFAVSQGTTGAPQPRTNPATADSSACAGQTPASGEKVVALVLDYGTAADAPSGEQPPGGVGATCVHVAKNATGLDVLGAAGVGVRLKDGLVCGLNGYPKTECATVVKTSPSPTRTASPSKSATAPSKSVRSAPTPSHAVATSPGATPTRSTSKTAVAPASSPPSASNSNSASASASNSNSGVASVGSTVTGQPSAAAAAAPSLVVGSLGAADGSGHGTPWPLVGGGALLVALAGGAGLRARRRP